MAKIRINGDTSGYIEISAPAVAGSTSITLPATTGGNFLVTDSSGNLNVDSGTLYVDATNNRVGIGITSPVYTLDCRGTIYSAVASGTTNFLLGDTSNGTQSSIRTSNNNLIFSYNASSEAARIDGSGRLLVGTSTARSVGGSSSIQLLHVEGTDYKGAAAFISNQNNSGGPNVIFGKSRSTSVGGTTIVSNGDSLGALSFNGADGSTLDSTGAVIQAFVDGTPGTNDMPGRLVFSTTADGASSPTERMRIDSSGRVGIGTTSPVDALHVLSSGGNTRIDTSTNAGTASLLFDVPASNGLRASGHRARISCQHEGAGWDSSLVFYAGNTATSPSEAMRIDASRRLLVGTTTADANTKLHVSASENTSDPMATDASITIANTVNAGNNEAAAIKFNLGSGNTASISAHYDTFSAGVNSSIRFYTQYQSGFNSPAERMRITPLGALQITFSDGGNEAQIIDRTTADGTLIKFKQAGTTEGEISVNGTTVTYGGGHLARWSQLPNDEDPSTLLKGTVLSNLDEMCEWGEEDNEQLNKTKVSDIEGDPNVAGVFVATSPSEDGPLDFFVGMTGDMIIRIAEGVTVERGDLLMSAGDGTAKPQDDDIIRSKTIAKVTSSNVSCTYDDGSYCVPCVLMAC